jgi:HPt (histidine-containing phosphotransfer) domain-containing protein
MGELAQLFLDLCPTQLSEMREALARNDNAALARAAHSLRGAVTSLEARAAHEAALRLETSAREGRMAESREAYAALEAEIERLKSTLTALMKGGAA